MGVVLAEDYYGGSSFKSFAVDQTLRWEPRKRVRAFNATAGSLSVTLPPEADCPKGPYIFVILNIGPTNAFTVKEDAGSSIIALSPNEGVVMNLLDDGADGVWSKDFVEVTL